MRLPTLLLRDAVTGLTSSLSSISLSISSIRDWPESWAMGHELGHAETTMMNLTAPLRMQTCSMELARFRHLQRPKQLLQATMCPLLPLNSALPVQLAAGVHDETWETSVFNKRKA